MEAGIGILGGAGMLERVQVMAPVKPPAGGAQPGGDGRTPGGDERVPAGTSGWLGGMSGVERRALAGGWALTVALAGAICVFNVMTRFHDDPADGLLLPLILEVSSFLVTGLIVALPAAVACWLRRARPRLWFAAGVLALGAVAYSVLHIAGFSVLRAIAIPLFLHGRYQPGPLLRELPYEFAKDALSYAVMLAAFRRLLGWTAEIEAARPEGTPDGPELFDIRDGGRLVRAPVGEILAVRSAGNYVEFWLADGRRPLMRSPLAAVEARLSAAGFVRTHRSWLVNAALVRGLRPEGSGDYAVELGPVEVPLSRRFPAALAALRG